MLGVSLAGRRACAEWKLALRSAHFTIKGSGRPTESAHTGSEPFSISYCWCGKVKSLKRHISNAVCARARQWLTIRRRSPAAVRKGAGVCSGVGSLFVSSDDRRINYDKEAPTQVVVYHARRKRGSSTGLDFHGV